MVYSTSSDGLSHFFSPIHDDGTSCRPSPSCSSRGEPTEKVGEVCPTGHETEKRESDDSADANGNERNATTEEIDPGSNALCRFPAETQSTRLPEGLERQGEFWQIHLRYREQIQRAEAQMAKTTGAVESAVLKIQDAFEPLAEMQVDSKSVKKKKWLQSKS